MKHKPFKVIRQINVFDLQTEKLVAEYLLENLDLEKIKSLLSVEESDPLLYYHYTIEGALQQYFEAQGFIFDKSKFQYDLACYQDN